MHDELGISMTINPERDSATEISRMLQFPGALKVEALSKGMLFWRSFSHWIGGMGILVFMLALLPSTGQNIHILRAGSPGPQVGKMVSKIKLSARILYIIYV